MPEPYELTASGDDDFRVFVLKTNFKEDRWIRAVDFKPGNRRVVHHVIAGIDASGKARELDAKDPGRAIAPSAALAPVFRSGGSCRSGRRGAGPVCPRRLGLHSAGRGRRLDPDPLPQDRGKPETDATAIGLYLSNKPLPKQVRTGFVFPNIPPEQMIDMAAKFLRDCQGRQAPELEEIFTMSW